MKKYCCIVILISLCINNVLFSQGKIFYQYKGTGNNDNINFTDNPVLTFDRNITEKYTFDGIDFTNINSNAILNNTLSIFNTGGKGITINPPFQAQKGSTLNINK